MVRTIFVLSVLGFAVPALAQQPCTTDARLVVAQLYQRVLERGFDASGQSFVTQLSSGQATVRDIVRAMATHQEHRQRFLVGNREAAVTVLYRHLLGREPDAGGLKEHVAATERRDLDVVIDAMLSSAEYAQAHGDYGVPGSNVRYCGPGQSAPRGAARQMRFPALDGNRNGRIERQEWNGTQQSFEVHDWNRDNVLSDEEVRVGGRRSAAQADVDDFDPATPGAFYAWNETAFTNLDRNRDGRIDTNEWYFDTEQFRRADRNRDGTLARNEFIGSVDTMDDDRDDRFENLDVNRNGRVERNEWHATDDAFDWLDRDRDNALTRSEVVGESDAPDQFSRLDVDRNGRLTMNEWRWSSRSFRRQDVNGDGGITSREFSPSDASR